MSFYNMLFGMNPRADLMLAVLGLRKHEVERFRDAAADSDGRRILVYTRTGGNNREGYPNLTMRKLPSWRGSVDDDFDSTYCTDTFEVPEDFAQDVLALRDVIGNGLRREFGQHLAKTLAREPTEADKSAAAYDAESAALKRTAHFMANGHTFVPMNDSAMGTALQLAEENGGELRTCWGILPLQITVKRDFKPWPNAKAESDRAHFVRIETGYEWEIDETYWAHCQSRWSAAYPKAMAQIAEGVARQTEQKRR